jgi:hypothetical protein
VRIADENKLKGAKMVFIAVRGHPSWVRAENDTQEQGESNHCMDLCT